MAVAQLVAAAFALQLALVAPAAAVACVTCGWGGPASRCIPNGGILIFNSVRPNVPAYWTLFADARGMQTLRRLEGDLRVHSDVVDPGVPGFPGESDGQVYLGSTARFEGVASKRRVRGVATYPDGATCRFRLRLEFGLGSPRPNAFVCRDATGQVVAEGAVDLQGIRLRGCRRGRRPAG